MQEHYGTIEGVVMAVLGGAELMVMTIMMVTMTMATYVYVYSLPVSHPSQTKAMMRTVELRSV